jgi:hypothetical protein
MERNALLTRAALRPASLVLLIDGQMKGRPNPALMKKTLASCVASFVANLLPIASWAPGRMCGETVMTGKSHPILVTAVAAVLASAHLVTGASPNEVAVPVNYSAPSAGFLSLALYNDRGQLVRSLLSAKSVKAGRDAVMWDGTSDLGIPQPAGRYSTKAIFFREKPRAEYVMTVGKSGNPPYRTPDGKGDWGGNLAGPAAICSNSNSVMMVWGCVEDNQITGIQQMDAEGNILLRYFSFYPWDTRLMGAMDDRHFYLGILNAEKKQVEIAAYELGKPRGKILTVLPTTPHEEEADTRWHGRFTASIDGLALTADTIVATIRADDALFIIDRATGQIRKQVSIASPRDVEVSGGGLILQTGNKIVRLTLAGDVERTLVDEGALTDPRALAVEAQGGFFSSGASGQIARFSADGKLLSKIGQAGGATRTGRYNPLAIGQVFAMCLAPKGNALWVQDLDTGFPRTSRWSLDGQLQREWFTPKLELFGPTINPARPGELLAPRNAFADEPGLSAYEIDWASKSWRPGWWYDNSWADMFACTNVYLGYEHGGNPLAKPRGGKSPWPIFHYGGRTFVSHGDKNYFINRDGNDDGAIFQYSSDHKPTPVALVGYHHVTKEANGRFAGSYDQGPNQWMTWADRNGDGQMSADEITHVKDVPALQSCIRVASGQLDAGLNVHLQMLMRDRKSPRYAYVLSPKEILPGGVPVYDWSMVRKSAASEPDFTGGDGSKVVGHVDMPIPLQADDGLYAVVAPSPAKKLELPGIDGSGWWASRNWRTKLAKFDSKTGELLWAVGRRAPGVAEPGQMYHPSALSGKGGDALFVADALGPVWLWHSDGLFIGHLFKDHPSGGDNVPVDQELYGEIQSTFIFTHPKTGRFYHIGTGNETRIHEIILPRFERLRSSTITLDEQIAKAAQAWDPDGVAPTEKPTYIASPAEGTIKIDGEFDGREGWFGLPDHSKRLVMLVMLDGQRLAEVRAMYDSENLYLGYTVGHPAGPANSGSELPYAPFVSGAYVDISIAPDWSTPQRHAVREGDVRVILARVANGGGTQTNFARGFWQKKTGGSNPRTIASPAATIHFDQIASVSGLQMAYKVKGKDERTGNTNYTVEVAVPLASLGLHDVAGKTIGFDVSVGIANPAGDQRDRAAHWAGLSEGRVVDRPGSAELLPHTWGTLTFAPATQYAR